MTEQILHSGEFNDYNGDVIKVTFYKLVDMQEDPDVENDLTFSGTLPVIINYHGDGDDIYTPLKTSSCDANIVSDQILDDLYTPKKNEICMRVGKRKQVVSRILKFDYKGSVTSTEQFTDLYNYTIYYKNLFYQDKFGDYRFNGQIQDRDGNVTDANLLYIPSTKTWERDNYWGMDMGDEYFYDGVTSYYIYWNGVRHYIHNLDDQENTTEYNKSENGVVSDCAYSVKNVVKYRDGSLELLWGNKRYTWNSANTTWMMITPYTDSENLNYYALYGSTYMQIKDKDGNFIDAAIANGVSGGRHSNYIVKLNRTSNTFERIIPLTDDGWNLDNVFCINGDIYVVDAGGCIYYWAWNLEEWIKWIEFTGDFDSNSFELDYTIDGTYAMIKYQRFLKPEFFFLNISAPPRVHYEEIPIEYDYDTIWEGYKLPNTYSQDVTQNLDEIGMSAIDPISMMKYVKIDQILDRPATKTYGELIALALSYVQFRETRLWVENSVTYGSRQYSGDNGILNLKCQVSNFWDEAGEPETLYTMLEEMLKPFCMTLTFDGQEFQLYSMTNFNNLRTYEVYHINSNGTLTFDEIQYEDIDKFIFNNNDWKSNNVQNAAIEIGSTYDKITAIASTCIPNYNNMAFDLIDYNDRDNYDAEMLNVQRNKSKGYVPSGNYAVIDSSDHWYFLWNGVYTNSDYELESHEGLVNGWLNINGAYKYLTGGTGNPNDYGSILNFYGGANNPSATGKTATEKYVKINKRITAYAPDNGTPLEFLEDSDIDWTFDGNVVEGYEGEGDTVNMAPELDKTDSENAKFGVSIDPSDTRIVYRQTYENIFLSKEQNTLVINLEQSYSRTGVDSEIDIMNNNTCTDAHFANIEGMYYMTDASMRYFPRIWNASSVVINTDYYSKYNTPYTVTRPSRVLPVWDKRRIMMYIQLSDNSVLQFNGKSWVSVSQPENANSFFLMKLMNGERLFHTDYKYNVIETSDGDRYSLTDEDFVYYTDEVGGVTPNTVLGGSTYTYHKYKDESKEWWVWVDKCSEGSLNINLPEVNDTGAKIIIDVYSSSLLGTTGGAEIYPRNLRERTWFEYPANIDTRIGVYDTIINFLPHNTTYVKGEHLNLDIEVTVPESNLGQMFNESDIKYSIGKGQGFAEDFTGPVFRVNTENNLVASSFSYLIFGTDKADPNQFYINGIQARPECYTVQAYFNWLNQIRKIYTKTLVPTKDTEKKFNNIRTYITSPEVPGVELMVISDSWDVKSNRHSIKSVDDSDMVVGDVESFNVIEVPRMARAERYNLPTAIKS